jgi:thiamine kinase-like enzyme
LYPNFLQSNAQKYTQSQLVASFLYLAEKIIDHSPETYQKVDELQKEAQKLGEALYAIDKEKAYEAGYPEEEEIYCWVDSVYDAMTEIVR